MEAKRRGSETGGLGRGAFEAGVGIRLHFGYSSVGAYGDWVLGSIASVNFLGFAWLLRISFSVSLFLGSGLFYLYEHMNLVLMNCQHCHRERSFIL
jgi:hypothetical protein